MGRTVQAGELLFGVFVVDLYLTYKHQISDGKQFRYNVNFPFTQKSLKM
jgi:hypothetical protein